MRRIIATLAVLVAPSFVVGDDEAVRKELQALRGTWKAVAVEADGKALPKEAVPDFTFVIGADGKSRGKMAKDEYTSTISVNPKKDPKTIDNLHESGPQKGKSQYGVYKLEGDTLTVCITAPGRAEGDRPKDFNTKGTANAVFVFERAKEDKKR